MFAVRYSNFQQLRVKHDLQNAALDLVAMFRDDVVPKSWWAVTLCDAVDLLQYSEFIVDPVILFSYMQANHCCSPRLERLNCLLSWKKYP
jgi:nuclear pore complex protein Nup85